MAKFRTEWGKIATMVYALFGIPVYILYFMNMGKVDSLWSLITTMIMAMITTPRCSMVANAGGRPFCHEMGMGWVHIGQWIFFNFSHFS